MLNWPHVHVMINHLPVIGFPLVLAVLAGGLLRRSRDLVRAALVLTVAIGGATPLVKLLGDQAEESVESTAWAVEAQISKHEEAGERGTILAIVTAVVAALALWLSRRGRVIPGWSGPVVAGLLLIASMLVGLTALEDGRIRHDEFGAPSSAGAEIEKRGER